MGLCTLSWLWVHDTGTQFFKLWACVRRMPAKCGRNLFVTVSLNYDPVVHKDTLVKWVTATFPDFVCFVREHGKDGKHPHYHIIGIADKEYRTDSVERSLYTLLGKDRRDPWTEAERKRGIVVKIHHDPVGCAGSYQRKEDDYEVHRLQGWSLDQLIEAEVRVDKIKERNMDANCPGYVLTLRKALAIIKESFAISPEFEEKWRYLSSSERYAMCYKVALKQGYAKVITIKPMEKSELLKHWLLIMEPSGDSVDDFVQNLFSAA